MKETTTNEKALLKYIDDLKTYQEIVEKVLKSELVYLEKLKRFELAMLEREFKSSLRWRIGSFFVLNLKRLVHLFKNPVRFIKDPVYRKIERCFEKANPAMPPVKPQPVIPNPPKKPDLNMISQDKKTEPDVVIHSENIEKNHNGHKPTLGVILDEFSMACLEPECNMITFRTDNWKEILAPIPPQALFIESAWNGNKGGWQYRIAKYQRNMGDELIDLLDWAKMSGIPSIFWNKEDPPNFDRFIDKAKLFDYIFTSDENCIKEYRKQVNHSNIFSLPFAAQPVIHNPLLKAVRDFSVCFAGTYHSDEYFERQNDMEILLRPSIDFGLHIYDRNFGSVAPGSERFRFPDIYQPFIKGRLNYDEMVRAYQQYKVFLNVNSVKDSPTMFSRRIFELLACGTPVISTYSKGIVDLLGDTVFLTESEEETKKHLGFLLEGEDNWEKASVRGIRKVMDAHTYDLRLRQVMEKTGIQMPSPYTPGIGVLSGITSDEQLSSLALTLSRQTLKPGGIILFSENPISEKILEKFRNQVGHIQVHNLEFAQNQLNHLIRDSFEVDYYAMIQPDDYYGADYLLDFRISTTYSNALCRGKTAYRSYQGGKLTLLNKGAQFKMNQSVAFSTLFFHKSYLGSFNPLYLRKNDQLHLSFVPDILALDSMNYLSNPDRILIPETITKSISA